MALKDPNYSFVDLATVNMMRSWIPELKAHLTAADTAGMAAHLAAADPHTQYALLAGRPLGQFLHGGTGAGESLQLAGTAHGTPGYVDVLSYGATTTSKGLRIRAATKIDFATIVLNAANVVGEENPTSYSNAQMLFYDGTAVAGVFSCSVGNVTAGRHFVWVAGVDRDGNKLPFAVFTTDAAGDPGSSSYAQCGLFISANQTAETAGMVGLGGNFSSASPPTAHLHLAPGTTSRAPFKYKSGPLLSTPAAGAVEFLTDKAYLTITTSAARKEFALCDAALTAGRVPFITTNGRLTDDAGLTFDSALGFLLVQKDQNGQTLVVARNYMALGNPLACAEFVVQSVDSGGYLGAFPSDYTQAAYRDRVVLGANSNAAGIAFCAMATGQDIRFYAGSVTECARFDSTGHLLIGLTSGSAWLHLKAGAAAAGSAPLKFTSGPVNTANEVGTVQFLTDRWYGVITTGAALKTFAFTSDLHAAVTLASPNHGLGLSTQVLTLGTPSTCTAATTNAVTTTTHTHAITGFSETSHNHALSGLSSHSHSDLDNIGANDHHDAITLAVSADVLLGLTGQALSLDTQTANYGLMGPATGDPAAPTFRALVAADIPSLAIYVLLAGRVGGQYQYGGTGSGDNYTLESTSDATKGYVLIQPNGGYVGIGLSSPAGPFDLAATTAITSGGLTALNVLLTAIPTGTSSASYYGASHIADYTANFATNSGYWVIGAWGWGKNSGNATLENVAGAWYRSQNVSSGQINDSYGMVGQSLNSSTGTIVRGYGVVGAGRNSGAGTVNTAVGVYADIINSNASGHIDNAYNIRAAVPYTNAGTIDNLYGIYIDAQSPTGGGSITNKWALYQEGTGDQSYFAGSVFIKQKLIGGTGVTDILKLQGTSGNGTLTSPAIQALVGNNGATVAWTVLNNGNFGLGTPNPNATLDVQVAIPVQAVYESQWWSTDVSGYAFKLQTVWDSIGIYQRFVQRFDGVDYVVLTFANGKIGFSGVANPHAKVHLPAGAADPDLAPLMFTSGPLLLTAQVGAVEFLTDKAYITITTSAARKEFALCDAALTSGRVPFVTTNGRLVDDATLLYDGSHLRAPGYKSSDGSPGMSDTITLASIATMVVKNGLIISTSA